MRSTLRNPLALLVSLLLLASACQPTQPAASPLTGTISEISGTVNVKLAEADEFTPVTAGAILKVNDQIQTGEDGHARIDLSSGTMIRVVPSSLITLQSNEKTNTGLSTKVKLELGRIFIILKGGSVDVETPSGVASVRSSYMMVEVNPLTQDIIATCLEGHCSASNPAGTQDFTSGQKATLFQYDPATGQYRPPQLENMNEKDFQDWLDANPEAKTVYDEITSELTAKASTATPIPTATPQPPTATQAAAVSAPACVELLTPTGDSQLDNFGTTEFSWSSYPGAGKYRLTIHYPNGAVAVIDTTDTSSTRYLDALSTGGNFTWDVTVLDAAGNALCQSQSISFGKKAPDPTETKVKNERPPATPTDPCGGQGCGVSNGNLPRQEAR
jgi:hypothetical protein